MSNRPAPRWAGGVVIAAGLALVVISALDAREDAFPSGRAPVTAAGIAFALAGLAIVSADRRRQAALGIATIAAMLVIPLWLAVPMSVGSRPPPAAPTFESVALALERRTFMPGELVRVRFDRPLAMPPGYESSYFAAFARPSSPTGDSVTFAYVALGDRECTLRAPSEPGRYELRLHAHVTRVLVAQVVDVEMSQELDR